MYFQLINNQFLLNQMNNLYLNSLLFYRFLLVLHEIPKHQLHLHKNLFILKYYLSLLNQFNKNFNKQLAGVSADIEPIEITINKANDKIKFNLNILNKFKQK